MRIRYIVLLLPLTACLEQSQVQYHYNVAKDHCQQTAASSVSKSPDPNQSTAAQLKSEFADCMKNNGWQLATAKAPTTDGQPIHTPSGPGVAAMAAAPAATSAAAPASAAAPTTATTLASPASATGTPVYSAPQAASTYQPYTPPASAVEPGRNFGPK